MTDIIDLTDKVKSNRSNTAEDIYERIVSCKENGEKCGCKYCGYRKKAANMLIDIMLRDITIAEKNLSAAFTSYDLKKIIYTMYDIIETKEKESVYKPIKGDIKLEGIDDREDT